MEAEKSKIEALPSGAYRVVVTHSCGHSASYHYYDSRLAAVESETLPLVLCAVCKLKELLQPSKASND